jgi:hypothetical protein
MPVILASSKPAWGNILEDPIPKIFNIKKYWQSSTSGRVAA